jgi:flagellar hook assembly protein FlgD
VTGQLVKSIYIGQKSAGEHTLIWDGRDEKEIKVSQGLYFICLKSNGKNITQKITLIK